MELGFPLLLLIRPLWMRLAFLGGVTFFHIANWVLMSVQFLFLPVTFVVFLDASRLIKRWRSLDPAGTETDEVARAA
jgi:hypothetical protein